MVDGRRGVGRDARPGVAAVGTTADDIRGFVTVARVKTPAAAPPDGTTTDLACPLCDYSLRGLTEPRCPECGFAFTWAELRDAERHRHRWLFEHGRGRNVKSFLATFWRSAFPMRFWRAVTPANPVHVGRLVAYWLLAGLPLLAVAVPVSAIVARAQSNLEVRSTYCPVLDPRDGSDTGLVDSTRGFSGPIPRATLDDECPAPWSFHFVGQVWGEIAGSRPSRQRFRSSVRWSPVVSHSRVAAAAVVFAWPWLSVVALLLFRASMRRAKVGRAHVLRVAVYGCDFGLLMAVLLAVAYDGLREWRPVADWVDYHFRSPIFPPDVDVAVFAVLACGVVGTYRLTVGYARYLRFHLPLATVIASQVIAALLAGAVLMGVLLRL